MSRSKSKIKVTENKKNKTVLFGSRPLGRGPRVAFFKERSSGDLCAVYIS